LLKQLDIHNKELNENTISKAAQLAMMSTRPISDLRASGDYRKHLVQVLVKRALSLGVSEVKKWLVVVVINN